MMNEGFPLGQPGGQQGAIAQNDFAIRQIGEFFGTAICHQRPDRVVAALAVADADNQRGASSPVDLELEEVRRAGDAGVVVADRLLAAMPDIVIPASREYRR